MSRLFAEEENLLFYHEKLLKPKSNQFTPHLHSTCEILLFVKGDATFCSSKYKYKLEPFDLILIPSNCFHLIRFDSDEEYERYCFAFSDEIAKKINFKSFSNDRGTSVIRLQRHEMLKNIFALFDYFYKDLSEVKFIDASITNLKNLFYFLEVQSENNFADYGKRLPDLLIKSLKYIDENLFTIKSITEINSHLFISYSYLVKMFKNHLNTTPKKYLTRKKLIEAQKFINDGEPLSSVSEKIGFESYALFYKAYTHEFGFSPSKQTKKFIIKENNTY